MTNCSWKRIVNVSSVKLGAGRVTENVKVERDSDLMDDARRRSCYQEDSVVNEPSLSKFSIIQYN